MDGALAVGVVTISYTTLSWIAVAGVLAIALAVAAWLGFLDRIGAWVLCPSICITPDLDVDLGLAPKRIPEHIAIIMDGNRRYGRTNFGVGGAIRGHRAGGHVLFDFIGYCIDYGVGALTVYAFSTENWNRDPKEIKRLMSLFAEMCPRIMNICLGRNVRVRVLASDYQRLPAHVQALLQQLEERTEHCTAMNLNLCVSYGGRGEIVMAAKSLAQSAIKGEIKVEDIDEAALSSRLQTHGQPDPDFVLRTSGERRLSNFLLWQVAYSEMIFVDKHWPELERNDFLGVLHEFARRKRRFGK